MRIQRAFPVVVAFALAGCLEQVGNEQGAGSVVPEDADGAVGAILIRGVLRCSAVLIDEWHVATAAYCLPAAHIESEELRGRAETFFVPGPSIGDPAARRIPVVAHEIAGVGVPEPLMPDVAIGRLAEPVAGPSLPLAPPGMVLPEWTSTVRVVSMGAPTASAPFGARRAVELSIAASTPELLDVYRTDTTFCMPDMGGAVIADAAGQPVLAGVLGHWATRGGEPASNGDFCSSAGWGQAFATRTEQGGFPEQAAARLDERMSFANVLVGPGPSGQWLLYESFPLPDNTAHGTGLTLPPGTTSVTVDLVTRPGDPVLQLASKQDGMPAVGQAPSCEPLGQACAAGSADACARFERECSAPTYLDADCTPVAAERQTCTLAVDGAEYVGVSVSNLSGDRPSTYALAAYTSAATD